VDFADTFFENCPDFQFHENPSSGSRVVPCGRTDEQTDVTELIVAIRNFANAPKSASFRNFIIRAVKILKHEDIQILWYSVFSSGEEIEYLLRISSY
jgi:hypothetical protein